MRTFRNNFYQLLFTAIVCCMTSAASAATTSYLLKINPSMSSSNTSGGFAGFNQNFTLSGTFNAHITDGSTIQFENVDVVGTALDSPNNQYPPGTVVKFTDFPGFPGKIDATYFGGSILIENIQQSYSGTFDGKSLAMKGQVLPISGADFFTTVYSLYASVVSPVPSPSPSPLPALSVGDVSVTTLQDIMAYWTPVVVDITMTPMPPTCLIVSAPLYGKATVDEYCASGSYTPAPGYVGKDGFTYQAVKGSFVSNIGKVSVSVLPPMKQCVDQTPIVMLTSFGAGQDATVNATLVTTFVGHIIKSTAGSLNICPASRLEFRANSTVGQAICKINGVVVGAKGYLKPHDRLVCSNQPEGRDIDRFRIR